MIKVTVYNQLMYEEMDMLTYYTDNSAYQIYDMIEE